MPEAYRLGDGKHIAVETGTSPADALNIQISAVPAGRIRTILSAYASCSVAETQIYWFAISSKTYSWPVTLPASTAIAPAASQFKPMLLEGMEIKLFPGENIVAWRAAATGGSTITIAVRYIESDMPLYDYLEPHIQRRLQRSARGVVAAAGGGGLGGFTPADGGGGGWTPGEGGGIPV